MSQSSIPCRFDQATAAFLRAEAKPGVRCTDLVTTAKDSQATVRFDNVFVAEADIVADGDAARRLAGYLCDLAAALMTSQLAGAARRDMEFAVDYAKQREASASRSARSSRCSTWPPTC